MTSIDWLVVLGAALGIGWVNWYFFAAGERAATAAAASGAAPAAVTITVKGGYSPNLVRVKAGAPVRLVFDRQETSSCSEEVVFPDFGIRRFLPAHERTTVEITPPAAGRYEFTCGMSMLHGAIVAEA
jgi:plastocyanin domain-containing protein